MKSNILLRFDSTELQGLDYGSYGSTGRVSEYLLGLKQTYTIPNPNKTINPSLTWSLTCRCQSMIAGYNAKAVSNVAPKPPWKYA